MSIQRYLDKPNNWNHTKNLIVLDTPIICDGYTILAYYPYERARISSNALRVSRKVFSNVWDNLPDGVADNKIVVICSDTDRFGTHDFAIFFHDMSACIGEWSDIGPY